MDYGLAGQIAVVWISLGFIAAGIFYQMKTYYARKEFRAQLRELLNTSNEAWATQHREWLDRRRGTPEIRLAKNELIRLAATEMREYQDEQAFALTDYESQSDEGTTPRAA